MPAVSRGGPDGRCGGAHQRFRLFDVGCRLGEELCPSEDHVLTFQLFAIICDLANLKTKGVGGGGIAMMLETQAKRGTGPAPPESADD